MTDKFEGTTMPDSAQGYAASPPSPVPEETPLRSTRKRVFTIFGVALLLIGGGYAIYAWMTGGRYVSTDNAYVNAELAQITSQTGGPVARVAVVNTQVVRRGDVLVELDPSEARIALAQAEADLARATRGVRQTIATGSSLSAMVDARDADIRRMQARIAIASADLDRAKIELRRREALVSIGGVSGEELTSARNGYAGAQGALTAAQADLAQAQAAKGAATGQYAANDALVQNTGVSGNPDVLAAKARVDKARLDLDRTTIRAPVDGVVIQRTVQLGQRVSPGAPLMAIVPVRHAYVDANFKESQLRTVRPGQPVELTSDIYGEDVVYNGRVVGLSGGTGSALAVIPAQNATGNWIKVVQRVPVRIALDPSELGSRPLRMGLSMTATIDTKGH
jgi:membrane fusion protein (multidrug efflux system)